MCKRIKHFTQTLVPLVVLSLFFSACNLPMNANDSQPGVTYKVGSSGNEVKNSDGVKVIIPQGSLKGDAELSVRTSSENPPTPAGVIPIGKIYDITLSQGAEILFPLEVYLPLERKTGILESQYAAMRWDGAYWTLLQGQVEGNTYHFTTEHTTLYRLNYFEADEYPVEFFNQSMTKVHIRPWQYQTFSYDGAIGPTLVDGRYPDGTSRGWAYLPPGVYTEWCVDWSEFTTPVWDIRGGGYWTEFIGNFHFIFGQEVLLNRFSEIEMSKPNTPEVRFSITSSIPGLCGRSPSLQNVDGANPRRDEPMPWTVLAPSQTKIYKGEAVRFAHKPNVIVYPQTSYKAPPSGVTVTPYCPFPNTSDVTNCWSINGLISLLETGQKLTVSNSNPSSAIGVQFWGSTNDGIARVSIDEKEVWQGSTRGQGPEYEKAWINYLQTTGLSNSSHTIVVENIGDGPVAIALIGFGLASP